MTETRQLFVVASVDRCAMVRSAYSWLSSHEEEILPGLLLLVAGWRPEGSSSRNTGRSTRSSSVSQGLDRASCALSAVS